MKCKKLDNIGKALAFAILSCDCGCDGKCKVCKCAGRNKNENDVPSVKNEDDA